MQKIKYDFIKILSYLQNIILFSFGQDSLFALYIIYKEPKFQRVKFFSGTFTFSELINLNLNLFLNENLSHH